VDSLNSLVLGGTAESHADYCNGRYIGVVCLSVRTSVPLAHHDKACRVGRVVGESGDRRSPSVVNARLCRKTNNEIY